MIHKCEDCKNRHDCPENKKQYEALCKAVEKLEKKKKYHCWYSLKLRCDYWVGDGVSGECDADFAAVEKSEMRERAIAERDSEIIEDILRAIEGGGIYPLLKNNDSFAHFMQSLMQQSAERVYSAGYRKVPLGGVVLTGAELDALRRYSSEHLAEAPDAEA